jgi:tRNA(Met) cytidine acetyltransferase
VKIKGKDKIVCSLQIALEGGLSDEIVDLLLRGNKIPGNIIPDRLLKHMRIREMGGLRGYRIVRIATHPKAQDKGIGSFALENLYKEAVKEGMDWVGSGFGVNPKLLNFWVKNNFYPLHMSPDRNPVSGEYTIIVLRPISDPSTKIVEIGKRVFREKTVWGLREPYNDLELETILIILKSTFFRRESIPPPSLDRISQDRLWIYSYGPMTYEAVSDVVYRLAIHYFVNDWGSITKLDDLEEKILILKVLQGRDWDYVAKSLRLRNWDAMMKLKEGVGKILQSYYHIGRDSEIGCSLEECYVDERYGEK